MKPSPRAVQLARAEPLNDAALRYLNRLSDWLFVAARLANHDWLVCLISDQAGADADTVRLVTKITAHNDVLSVFVHDPLEQQLPDIGRAVLAEGDRQIEVDLSALSLRQRFSDDFVGRRQASERYSLHRAIPELPIATDRDVVEQFREQFREQLGRRLARRQVAA